LSPWPAPRSPHPSHHEAIHTRYDADGNLLQDPSNAGATNAFDAEGRPVSLLGTAVTYDALGREIESGVSGGPYQILYAPDGTKLGLMNGASMYGIDSPLPGGGAAVYNGSGFEFFRHAGALGSAVLTTNLSRALLSSDYYAPFGFDESGAGAGYRSFTGQKQSTDALHSGGQYDFLHREYNPIQGRWWTPDPAGVAAVDPNNPQSWNEYAYVGGAPLGYIDPGGTDAIAVNFTGMVGPFGHEGVVVIRPDGTAEYARFGPVPAGSFSAPGQVRVYQIGPVQIGLDGLPTAAGFQKIADAVARDEDQSRATVRMNYFATTLAGTQALESYISQTASESQARTLPKYNGISCNCADYALGGLAAAGAVPSGSRFSPIPDEVCSQLAELALESWANGAVSVTPPPACVEVVDYDKKACK
jgi:RHS repeat-associated protein